MAHRQLAHRQLACRFSSLQRTAALAAGLAFVFSQPAQARRPPPYQTSLAGDYLAAAIAGADHDAKSAAKYYRRALAVDTRNPELIERTFTAMLAAGEINEAFPYAAKLVARGQRNTLARLALAIRDIKDGDYRQARDLLAKLGGSDSSDVTATALTAWAEMGLGQPTKALSALSRLKETEGIGSFRAYQMALIDDLTGRVDAARKLYKQAQDLNPGSVRIVDARARFEARNGDVEEAKRLYGDFDRLSPRNPVIAFGMTEIAKGKATPRIIETPRQGASEALFSLASSSGRDGEDFAAVLYLRLALYLDPDNALASVTLGEVYERSKSYDLAIAAYSQVPEGSPVYLSSQLQIGLDLVAQEKFDEAIAHLTKIAAANAGDLQAQAAVGDAYRGAKKFPEAAEAYAKAITLAGPPVKANWLLYYDRGICYERAKHWDKAEADLKQALDLYPDQPLVLNYLGYSWVDRGLNIDEAFKMLRRAVDLRPKDGYIVDSLGWAFYRMGRYDDAVRTLQQAINLKPNDPTINDHLGDAYWHVGRKLEAGFQWAHARDMKPEPEDLPAILKKIQTGEVEDKPVTPEASGQPDKAAAPAKSNGG